MLYVKTKVLSSAIEGLGLFADEFVAKGALIAQYNPRFGWQCAETERDMLPPIAKEFLWRYGWRNADGIWLMDVDNSRFMNHSNAPNMKVTTEAGFTSRAARDIERGEELTEDYRDFDPDFEKYGAKWK